MRKNLLEDYRHVKACAEGIPLSDAKRAILNESIFQNVNPLIDDIMKKLEAEEYEFTYSKTELLSFMQGFIYRDKFKNEVPDRFRLTVMCLSRELFYRRFGVKLTENAIAEEVLDPFDEWHEIIDIVSGQRRNRFAVLKEYLKEELRHVWTYVFGMADGSFYVGRTTFNAIDKLDESHFNSFQRQVLRDMYFGDISALQKDYDYVFKIQDGNAENWELSVHIDAIIDMLIDYYTEDIPPEEYLSKTISSIKTNRLDKDSKLLIDFYTREDANFKSTKDNIRRLFMLLAFGSKEQLDYFENECRKEFCLPVDNEIS